MSNQQLPPPQPLPPRGWYPDPEGRDGQRYWTGTQWTAFKSAGAANSPTKGILFVGGLLAALIAVGSIVTHISGKGSDASHTTSQPTATETAKDKAFIAKLDAMDVPYTSRRETILKGAAVCLFLDANPNAEFSDAVDQIRNEEFSDLSGFDAKMKALSFTAAATDVYCPEHKPTGSR